MRRGFGSAKAHPMSTARELGICLLFLIGGFLVAALLSGALYEHTGMLLSDYLPLP